MTYEIKYRQMDIPELDAFLEEYRALCERHGVQFASEDYGYDGGHYMTIEKYSDGGFYLNLDNADSTIPFMAKVFAEAERLNDIKYAREREERRAASEAARVAREQQAISGGVVLGGKRYKLVPDEPPK